MNLKLIDLPYIESLIENKVRENQNIEYKLKLNLWSQHDKEEFCNDISSFANCQGGMIIYGIKEIDSAPALVKGIKIESFDQTTRQIEGILLDGITPRISEVELKFIAVSEDRHLLVINIGKSIEHLHQVTHSGTMRVCSRRMNSKYFMDIHEISDALKQKNELLSKVEPFISERKDSLIKSDHYALLMNNPKIILQVVPASAILTEKEFSIYDTVGRDKLRPLGGGNIWPRNNEYGLFIPSFLPNGTMASYLQIYRNGLLETVNSTILWTGSNPKLFFVKLIEGYLMRELQEYLEYYKHLEVKPPIFIRLTFIGLKGYHLSSEAINSFLPNQPYSKDVLLLPTLRISDIECDIARLCLKWFNRIWQEFGFAKSSHFNENGDWVYNLNHI